MFSFFATYFEDLLLRVEASKALFRSSEPYRPDEIGGEIWDVFFKYKRSQWVREEERKFMKAANRLKTLQVTPEGGMRIDPEEIRDQIIAGRELYKQFVKR